MSVRLSSVHWYGNRARQHARARRNRQLWALEGLEGRVLLSGSPTYYTVNLTSDTGAASGTDAYPVTGAPSGDLLWAITQANANTNPAGSVIEFDPTIFATTQTITLSSTLELSESAGPEVIDGPSAGVVVSGNNAVEVFQIDGGVTGTLAGLTISGGSATYGDAISNYGSLTVSGSTIEGNSGGGISNNGSLTVTGTTIEGNTSGGSGGGGLFNVGTTTITGCTIEDNSANGQWGGGGILNGGGTLTVTDSTFAGNSSTEYGGAISNAPYGPATATIIDSTIQDNTATLGGGILNNVGTLTVTDTTVSGNSSNLGGGIDSDGTSTVIDSTISGNSTTVYGGGIFNGGTLTLENTTIADNETGFPGIGPIPYGGGIYNEGTLTAVNSTVAYNHATGYGGAGVYDAPGAATILYNTVVAANTDGAPDDIDGTAASVVGQYDLVGVDNTGSLSNGNNGNQLIGSATRGWACWRTTEGRRRPSRFLQAARPSARAASPWPTSTP